MIFNGYFLTSDLVFTLIREGVVMYDSDFAFVTVLFTLILLHVTSFMVSPIYAPSLYVVYQP